MAILPASADPDGRPRVAAYGEGAVLVDLGIESTPDRAARTHAAAAALRSRLPDADVVVGAGTILVEGASRAEVEAIASGGLGAALDHGVSDRIHCIPAVYD